MGNSTSGQIGIEYSPKIERAGLRGYNDRLSEALRSDVVGDCLEELYDEYLSNKSNKYVENEFRTPNQIVEKSTSHSNFQLKNEFRDRDDKKFDFWEDNTNVHEGFHALANLGLVDCYNHFGQYRVIPDEKFAPWLVDDGYFNDRQAPFPPTKNEEPELHFYAVRFGWNILSHTDEEFEYRDQIAGCYVEQTHREVAFAASLEQILEVWIEDLSFDWAFSGTESAVYEVDLQIQKQNGKPVQGLSDSEIDHLISGIDTQILAVLAEAVMPIYKEEEMNPGCTCANIRQHISRSVEPDYNIGHHTQNITEKDVLNSDYESDKEGCEKAVFDELERTKKELPTKSDPVDLGYRFEIKSIGFSSRGGRIPEQ